MAPQHTVVDQAEIMEGTIDTTTMTTHMRCITNPARDIITITTMRMGERSHDFGQHNTICQYHRSTSSQRPL